MGGLGREDGWEECGGGQGCGGSLVVIVGGGSQVGVGNPSRASITACSNSQQLADTGTFFQQTDLVLVETALEVVKSGIGFAPRFPSCRLAENFVDTLATSTTTVIKTKLLPTLYSLIGSIYDRKVKELELAAAQVATPSPTTVHSGNNPTLASTPLHNPPPSSPSSSTPPYPPATLLRIFRKSATRAMILKQLGELAVSIPLASLNEKKWDGEWPENVKKGMESVREWWEVTEESEKEGWDWWLGEVVEEVFKLVDRDGIWSGGNEILMVEKVVKGTKEKKKVEKNDGKKFARTIKDVVLGRSRLYRDRDSATVFNLSYLINGWKLDWQKEKGKDERGIAPVRVIVVTRYSRSLY